MKNSINLLIITCLGLLTSAFHFPTGISSGSADPSTFDQEIMAMHETAAACVNDKQGSETECYAPLVEKMHSVGCTGFDVNPDINLDSDTI